MSVESFRSASTGELPTDPILSIDEVDLDRDWTQLAPEVAAQLGPEEQIVRARRVPLSPRQSHPSANQALLGLAGVTRLEQVGERGPANASAAAPGKEHDPALTKYIAEHARDSLTIALDVYQRHPQLLEATLLRFAETQGVENERYTPGAPFRQEEEGKIIHTDRAEDDPIARKFSLMKGWGWPFYGSIDATPLFISAAVQHARHKPGFLREEYTARNGERRTMRDSIVSATDWLAGQIDKNPDGLLEFKNPVEEGGMRSQAWKDSDYAYVHSDGRSANYDQGIASVEVQGLAYDALLDAASIHKGPSSIQRSHSLQERAEHLRSQVMEWFWVEDERGGYFALGTDRDDEGFLRPLQVRSSNMGRLLNSRLLDGKAAQTVSKRHQVVNALFADDMLCPSGIRTLSTQEAAFQPGGYHTGTVWPWDNYQIALGLDRHHLHEEAREIKRRMWHVFDSTGNFVEHVRGSDSEEPDVNTLEVYVWNKKDRILYLYEQPPQEIQGWSVSAMLGAKYNNSGFARR